MNFKRSKVKNSKSNWHYFLSIITKSDKESFFFNTNLAANPKRIFSSEHLEKFNFCWHVLLSFHKMSACNSLVPLILPKAFILYIAYISLSINWEIKQWTSIEIVA